MDKPTSKDGGKFYGGKLYRPVYVPAETHARVKDLREKSGMLVYRIIEEALDLFEAQHGLGG